MDTITLNRITLYNKIWSEPISDLCLYFDIWEDGLEEICRRLNIPVPDKSYWRKVAQVKKVDKTLLPSESRGTETVVIYKRDDELQKQEQIKRINALLQYLDITDTDSKIDVKIFDKLILSTREATLKHWEVRHDQYWEKNKILAIHVSPEQFSRALLIMDLLIKLLRFKKHDLIIEQRNTFAVVNDEKIQISIGEKKKRVEFFENKRTERDLHPTGCLYLRKEGNHYHKKEWKDGKVPLDDQLLKIVDDLEVISIERKDERARAKKAQEDREEQARIRQELEKKQKAELARFRQLLFEAHRFSVSAMLHTYIDKIESNALSNNSLNEETREWISWARQKADWFDPSAPGMAEELLNGIDIENLKVKDNPYTGYYYNSGNEQMKDNFWKPWWSR